MTEQDLREAFRRTMAASTPPPPMSAASVMHGVRRTRIRRSVWAGAGCTLAVATIAMATAAIPGSPGPSLQFGGPGPSVAPNPDESKPEVWPTGPDGQPQQDRTARAGERYDKGVALLAELEAVVPAGYTVPDDPETSDGPASRTHQAQFENRVGGTDVWSYQAIIQIAQGQRLGGLLVEVHTAGNTMPGEPCALTHEFWGMTGECQVVSAGAAQVGVVVNATGPDRRYDQWAAYRHPDGVVVFVAQSAEAMNYGTKPVQPLAKLPFTVQQLATLAISEKLHLT
jgi:hypothetical protein